MQKICWLHLSDVHYAADDGYRRYNRTVVLEALFEDIRQYTHQVSVGLPPIDFVVVTGDLAHSGKEAEYALVTDEFLEPLRQAVGFDDYSRIFVVPGNHDIDRGAVSSDAREIRARLRSRDDVNEALLDEVQRDTLMRRQQAYFAFFSHQFPTLAIQQPGGYYVTHFTANCGATVSVLGLNSAWMAEGGEQDHGAIAIGEAQLDAAVHLALPADLQLALVHHPSDWLREDDSLSGSSILAKHCDFILRGHLHAPDLIAQYAIDGDVLVIPSGSVYGSRDWRNGYNYVCVDLGQAEIKVHLRRWDSGRREWLRDTGTTGDERNGVIHPTPPSRLRCRISPSEATVRRVHDSMAVPSGESSRRWTRVAGLRPSAGQQRVIGRQAVVAAIEAFASEHDVSCVVGLPGVGKSTVVSECVSILEHKALTTGQPVTVAWLTLAQDTELVDIVGSTLELLGVHMPDLREHSAASQIRLLVEGLRENPTLLVLDQIEQLSVNSHGEPRVTWVNSLVSGLLEGIGPSKAILIAWSVVCSVSGIQVPSFPLDGLGLDDAVALLQYRGVAGSERSLREAAARTAGHPLALTLLAQAAQGAGALEHLLSDETLWQGQGQEIAERVLGRLYITRFDASERGVLEALCVLRCPSSTEFLEAITERSTSDGSIARAVARLTAQGIVSTTNGFYWLHPIVHAYIEPRIKDANVIHRGAASLYAALAYMCRDNIDEHIALSLQALYHAERAPDLPLAATLVICVSGVFFDRGAAIEIGELAERVLTIDASHHQLPVPDTVSLLGITGRSLRYAGKVDEAISTYNRTLHLADRASDRRGKARILNYIGAALLQRDYGQSLRRSRDALVLAQQVGDKGLEAAALGNIGIALRHLDRQNEAKIALRQALEIQREVDDLNGQIVQLAALALADLEVGDVVHAEAQLLEALEIADRGSLSNQKARILSRLGHLYGSLELLAWAVDHYSEALRIWRRMAVPEGASEALLELARIWLVTARLDACVVCALSAKGLATMRPEGAETAKKAEEILDMVRTAPDEIRVLLLESEESYLKKLDALLAEPTPRLAVKLASAKGDTQVDIPDDPRYWNDYAATILEEEVSEKDATQAEALLRAAVDRNRNLAAPCMNLGNLLSLQDRDGEAEWFLRRAVTLEPTNTEALCFLGLFFIKKKRWQESLAPLRNAANKGEYDRRVQVALVVSLLQTAQADEAVSVSKQLVDRETDDPESRLLLVEALHTSGQYDPALQQIDEILKRNPNDGKALIKRIEILNAMERDQDILDAGERMLSTSTLSGEDIARVAELVACTYFRRQEMGKAEKMLTEAIEAAPSYASAYYHLGLVLHDSRPADAERAYRRCLELESSMWWARNNLAILLTQAGKLKQAREQCQLALDLNPDCQEAAESLREIEALERSSESSRRRDSRSSKRRSRTRWKKHKR